jgi:hypothetical protein
VTGFQAHTVGGEQGMALHVHTLIVPSWLPAGRTSSASSGPGRWNAEMAAVELGSLHRPDHRTADWERI